MNGYLKQVFDHYNKHLFNEQLPFCRIELTERHKGFVTKRFNRLKTQTENGVRIYLKKELAAAPLDIQHSDIVHNMCHYWQYLFGRNINYGVYHNSELSDKMQSIGLMPSSTGKPGGKKKGPNLKHYIIENGLFSSALKEYRIYFRELQMHDDPLMIIRTLSM